ncbi:MAG: MFS transporter [Clostridia bacterium]|nr:MFS transporter [Clostridia bacterium]
MSKMNDSKLFHKLFGTTPGKGVQPKEAFAYSVAGFGQNFICTIIGSYITVFMTDALLFGADGVTVGTMNGAIAVAILMLAARVFDAFNDPIMGSVVDKTRTKWGKCRPYLKWMAIPIGIMTILCFLPVFNAENVYNGSQTTQTFVTIAVIYVVWSVVYTIADVPYWGLSTCLTNDTETRGNILTVARMFCTVGAGIVTIFIPMITGAVTSQYKYTDSAEDLALIAQHKAEAITNMVANQGITAEAAAKTFVGTVKQGMEIANADTLKWVYFISAVVLVVAAMPMFFYGFKNTKERFTSDENPPSFGHNLKLLFKNKELLLIVLSGILGGARMVYSYTGGLYFAKYILQNEGLYGIITLLVVPGGLVASILVPWMSKKFTKKWSYIAVHIFGGIVMAVMYFVGYDAPWKMIICAIGLVLLGIPQGVNNIITYAMIGDTVDYLEWKTGERGEGICFAMQTLINKIGMAVGAFIGVLSMSIAGINARTYEVENPQALWNVLIISGIVSMFACAVPMFFYTITEKKQKAMVDEIAARKLAAGQAVENTSAE